LIQQNKLFFAVKFRNEQKEIVMSKIDDLISALADGKANSKHAPQLEESLDMDIGHTQEPTRDLIRDAIVSRDYPIGSLPRSGYFLIDTEEELNEVLGNLHGRIDGLQRRIDALSRGWQRRQDSRASGGNWPK
jgi:hypothetical protein